MYKINSFSFQKAVQKHVTGTTRKRISRTNLGNIKFHVPPLSEQKRIVAILDKAQQLIDLRRQQLTKLDELIQSIFYDMFGDPVTNPKGWEVKKLGEVSSLTTKGSSPKWQGFDYQSQGIRFITSENVLLGKLDVSKDKFIPEEFHDKLSRSKLAENDLLINLVGASIGRSCLMTKDALPANINQAVSLTRLSVDLTNPLYVLYLLITQPMQDELCGNKVEGARANISLKNVRELKIIFPPLELQNQFASKVEKIEGQKKVMQQSLAKLEENFKALQQRAFRGHL
jgi:type I restriction enzyme S subunit